ncbi:hypothetical protein KKC97_05770, partial [bacterium]|nr:hypothetical protein [bacterium]
MLDSVYSHEQQAGRELPQSKHDVDEFLRQFGIVGEDAFYLILSNYSRKLSSNDKVFKNRILARSRNTRKKLSGVKEFEKTIKCVLEDDPSGNLLPVWYQYFVGRRFRGDS